MASGGQLNHFLMILLHPATLRPPVHHLDRHWFLLLSQHFQERSFLKRIFWRRRTAAFGIWTSLGRAKSHAHIVHKARELQSHSGKRRETTRVAMRSRMPTNFTSDRRLSP